MEETYIRLKEIIKATEINYKWISKATNISVRTIKRWMKGSHQPHPVLFLELKKVVDRLFDLTF